YIAYALTVNPTIYVSCIKQFWNTVSVKQSNDVTKLQALVDKKKVVVTEATIKDALHLDDAEGVDCLPNEEIFTTLARMGYEKPSTKLTFYKAFFSSDLSTHSTKYISPALTQKVFANIRRVGKGCLGVKTPLFEGMLVAREPENQGDAEEQGDAEGQGNDDNAAEEPVTTVDDVEDQTIQSPNPLTSPPQKPQNIPSTSQVKSPPPQKQSPPPAQPQGTYFPMSLLQEALDACAALARRVEHLEHDNVAQDLEIIKLKSRVKKLERANKGRMIDESDKEEGAELMNEKEEKETEEEAVEVVTTAKLITEVIATVSETVSAAAVVTTTAPFKDKGKGIMVEEPKPMKNKQQVELDEAYARKLQEELNQDIDWEVAMDHVKQKAKENAYVQRYQVMKKRPQTEAQARRNMMVYLKNTAGFTLDYFKGMSYDDIRPIFEAKFNANMEFLLMSKEQMEEEENRATDSLTRLQLRKFRVDVAMKIKEKHQVFTAASEDINAARKKLMLLVTAVK
nr:xylulose kinase-1 [Tanacetum cinerariifolium]